MYGNVPIVLYTVQVTNITDVANISHDVMTVNSLYLHALPYHIRSWIADRVII